MSFSPIPGAMVPVSTELYGRSRVASGRSGICRGARADSRGDSAGGWAPAGEGGAGSGGNTVGGGATGWGVAVRPRRSAIFCAIVCLIFAYCSLTCLHPKVAVANSAHIHSVLRRMSSLHRVKDTGSILAAQDRGVAALRVRHDADHVAASVADAGDITGRAVGVVPHVAPHDPVARFELRRGALVHDVAAVAMRNRDLEHVALVVQTGKRGARGLDTHPGGPRQKLEPRVPHQPARQEPRLAQDLKPVADAEDRPAGARVRGDGAHDRREPGDRARAKVIA